MKVGVSLPQATLANVDELKMFAEAADACGFDSLWAGDHVVFPSSVDRSLYPYVGGMRDDSMFFPEQRWTEAIVSLAIASTMFPRGDVGFAVILPALRSPVILAKQLAAIDLFSGGRLVVGVGVGWLKQEYAAMGIPFAERWPRVREMVSLFRELWTGAPTTFDGEFTQFEDMVMRPPPPQGPDLRVWYGGNDVALLRQLGVRLSGWIPYEPDAELLARGREVIEGGGWKDVTIGAVTRLPLGQDDLSRAEESLDAYRESGVEHLVVVASVGRSADENRIRIERLASLRECATSGNHQDHD